MSPKTINEHFPMQEQTAPKTKCFIQCFALNINYTNKVLELKYYKVWLLSYYTFFESKENKVIYKAN